MICSVGLGALHLYYDCCVVLSIVGVHYGLHLLRVKVGVLLPERKVLLIHYPNSRKLSIVPLLKSLFLNIATVSPDSLCLFLTVFRSI